MELNDALRIPLAPSDVWEALHDLALLRASLDNCESFARMPGGEYALTMTVPLGPLRAHYDVRAHIVSPDGVEPETMHRMLNFKARAQGVGALRGQMEVRLRADDHWLGGAKHPHTRIDYSVWATLTGPLSQLPARQIENALHDLADTFFTEFCEVVQAKHGMKPNRVHGTPARRQHVFLRPVNLSALARRARPHDHGGALTGRAASTILGARAHQHEHDPHAVPNWAWAGMIFFVAVLLYLARWFSQN
jgi:carbon monoxide dehydrogenase subunit G